MPRVGGLGSEASYMSTFEESAKHTVSAVLSTIALSLMISVFAHWRTMSSTRVGPLPTHCIPEVSGRDHEGHMDVTPVMMMRLIMTASAAAPNPRTTGPGTSQIQRQQQLGAGSSQKRATRQ